VNDTTLDEAFTGISHSRTKLSSGFGVYYSMRTKRVEGSDMNRTDETRVAEQIVGVLPSGVARALSAERQTIRYAVRGDGMKLRTIVLNRESLRRLIDDPLRDVKIEYLQRDLLAAAAQRSEFQYPRPHLHPVVGRAWPFALAIASAR
jgi:hypothetical protein